VISSIATNESELPREDNLKSVSEAFGECIMAFMKWPCPLDPKKYTEMPAGLKIFGSTVYQRA
jgi:hypothetical protein